MRTLYFALVVFYHRVELNRAALFPPNPEIKPTWTWLWRKKKHDSSYLRSTTNYSFAWHSDVEMSNWWSVFKGTHTNGWKPVHLPASSCCFALEIAQLIYIFPLTSLPQFLLYLSDIINCCGSVYWAHPNVSVNKLVPVMLIFVVLHG